MTHEELQAITMTPGEQSTVTLTGEIPFSYLAAHRDAAVQHLSKDLEVDGFRKGHIPEHIVVERVGEMALLTEMAERAMQNAYPKMLEHFELDAIGYPQIKITKIADNNPLGFEVTIAVMPEITLPDYTAIASETNKDRESAEVTEEDIDAQIEDILRQKVAYERMQEKAQKSAAAHTQSEQDGDTTQLPTPESEAAKAAEAEEDVDPKDLPLPELTDEYVKTLGQPGQFESVADFRSKIREHLEEQKKQEAASNHRAKITDAIIAGTEVALPEVMIDAELNQMFAQMEDDLTRAQLTMDDYLTHIQKSREDLKAEWRPAAEKRAALQLILNEIAKKEGIEADAATVEHNVSTLMDKHKDADEARVRTYVQSMLTNEEVMQFLENK